MLRGVRRRGRRLPDRGAAGAPATPTTRVSDRLVREIAGAWKPNQYANPNNPRSHYETTGPEIWAADRRPDHPLRGRRRHRRHDHRHRPLPQGGLATAPVRVIGADPEGSVYSGGTGRPYLVEGVGEDFWPTTYDRAVRDEIIAVSRRRLVRDDPAAGPRGGPAGRRLVRDGGGRRAARSPRAAGPDDVVVVLLPDGGRGYLSKIFNDEWMADVRLPGRIVGRPTVGDVLRGKAGELPGAGARAPERDGPRRDRHPARVRRLADAGRQGRAAGDGRRGGRVGVRARPARRAVHRAGPPGRPGGAAHGPAAADDRRAASRCRRPGRRWRRPTPSWSLVDGKPAGVLTRQDLLGFLAD